MYGGTAGNSQGSRKLDKGGLKLAKYHVGVEISQHKHKACIRNLAQDSYSGVFSFDVNRQGFEKFLGTLEKVSQNK